MQIFKDFVILPGGADINPAIYGKTPHKSTYFHNAIDKKHIEMYEKAVKENRPILGICRGMQLISALNGLPLVQDMSHPGLHEILVPDLDSDEDGVFSKTLMVNSYHHQNPTTNNLLEGDNFKVYGFASLSKKHHGEVDDEYEHIFIEPEIIWFPEVKALGIQGHPEYFSYTHNWELETMDYLEKLVNKLY